MRQRPDCVRGTGPHRPIPRTQQPSQLLRSVLYSPTAKAIASFGEVPWATLANMSMMMNLFCAAPTMLVYGPGEPGRRVVLASVRAAASFGSVGQASLTLSSIGKGGRL